MQLSEEQIDAIIDSVATYGDNGGREYPPFAVARAVEAALRAQADARPVGQAGTMPGADGFTMACFKATDVPAGTNLYTHPEASAPGLSEDEWLGLAERHIKADWNSEQPDGYLNAVKALAQDAMSLTRASHQPSNAEALGLSKDEITDVWIKHGGPLNGNNFHSFARAILTRASAATVGETNARRPLTADEVAAQYDEQGIHIGSGLPAETCPCGLCKKVRESAQQQAEPHTSQAHPTFQTVSVPNGPGTPSAQTFDRRIACKPGQPEWKSCKQQAEPGADERAAIEAIARLDGTYYHQWVKNPLGYVSGNVPINDIVAVIEWARAAQSGQRAGVAEGWRFYSADFSITAHQPSQPGYVMLIRDEIGYKKWHRMDEAAKEEIPLFVTGRGVTFEKALLHANENAMLAAAPTQQQDNQS